MLWPECKVEEELIMEVCSEVTGPTIFMGVMTISILSMHAILIRLSIAM